MVMKRKLPSSMGAKPEENKKGANAPHSGAPKQGKKPNEGKKEQRTENKPAAEKKAPAEKKDVFGGFGDDTKPKGKAPVAPEPKVEAASSAIPHKEKTKKPAPKSPVPSLDDVIAAGGTTERPAPTQKPTTPQAPAMPVEPKAPAQPAAPAEPVVPSFADLPSDDFSIATTETKSTEPKAASWDEEPQEGIGWDFEDLDSSDDDVFGSMAKEAENVDAPLPPWQQGAAAGEAPELPTSQAKPKTEEAEEKPEKFTEVKADPKGALIGIAMLSLIGFGVYKFFVEKEETTEVISRWTGSLNEVSEQIPAVSGSSTGETGSALKPETVVSMDKGEIQPAQSLPAEDVVEVVEEDSIQPMEDEIAPETSGEPVFSIGGTVESNRELNVSTENPITADVIKEEKANNDTVVEFVDVSEDQVEKPIDATDAIDMPEEVGMIAQLQQAINKARLEKNPDDFKPTVPETSSEPEELEMLTPEELDSRNKELSVQLEEELAEYRRILAGDGEEQRKIKPSQFFDEKAQEYAGEQPVAQQAAGSIPLPKRQSALISQEDAQSLYGANPYGLPVVPEPSQERVKGVRTIDDFDVSMFQVERQKVRIPTGVKPSLRGERFPQMYLLSTVVDKGIVAEMGDKQGVLLIGETVSGWELISVKAEYAEFSNGKRKHIVSIGR